MSPALTPLISALERAAALIERGIPAAKALRQVAQEVQAHADAHPMKPIPSQAYTHELGIPYKRAS